MGKAVSLAIPAAGILLIRVRCHGFAVVPL